MQVFLIDGTYELFRHYYALPSARGADGVEVAAVRGRRRVGPRHDQRRRDAPRRRDRPRHRVVSQHALARLQDGRRHRARPAGAVPAARRRAPLARRGRLADGGVRGGRCAGVGAAAARARDRAGRAGGHLHARQGSGAVGAGHAGRAVESPARVRRATRQASSASSACRRPRFPTTWPWSATPPTAIPVFRGWGPKSTAAVLAKFGHLESIPDRLARVARERRQRRARWRRRSRASATQALLFRELATLRTDIPLFESVDELEWRGPTPAFARLAAGLDKAAT